MSERLSPDEPQRSPEIALLLPCFNAEKFLPAIASAAKSQTVPFSQKLAYDDGSVDHTVGIARELGFEVIEGRQNRGAGYARNRLLEAAKTPWIHFQDVDDRMDETFNEKLSPFLDSGRCAALCAFRWIEADGKSVHLVGLQDVLETSDWVRIFIQQFLHLNCFIFPTAFARSAGGFHEELRIAEDREFILRLAAKGLKFRYLNEPLVDHIVHSASTISTADSKFRWRQELEFYKHIHPELSKQHQQVLGDYALYRAWSSLWAGDTERAKVQSRIANEMGFFYTKNTGVLGRWVSKRFGTFAYYRIKRLWAGTRHLLGRTKDSDSFRSENLKDPRLTA